MKTKMATTSEQNTVTAGDIRESMMKCAEAERCFGVGKDMDDDELRRILKKEEKQTLFISIPKDEQERGDFRNLAKSIENEGRRILREEFMKNHQDFLYGSKEGWVHNMTPEQREECQSLAQKAAMEMVSPAIGLKEAGKLVD